MRVCNGPQRIHAKPAYNLTQRRQRRLSFGRSAANRGGEATQGPAIFRPSAKNGKNSSESEITTKIQVGDMTNSTPRLRRHLIASTFLALGAGLPALARADAAPAAETTAGGGTTVEA